MPRLFIALPINKDISKDNSIEQVHSYIKKYDKELKVVSPENYHITLKFLGDCSDKTADRLLDNFENITEIRKAINYQVFGIGAFPDLKKAEIIWAGIKTDEVMINRIIQDIEKYTHSFGFKKDKRKFVAHLTLARLRKSKNLNENLRQFLVEKKESFFFESNFNRLALIDSTLTPEGPVYKEIKSIELNGIITEEL